MDYIRFIEKLHELIIERISDKKHWAQEVAGLLNISTDAMYKKARFESKYSVEELLLLSQTYKISLDHILKSSESDNIIFNTPFLNKKVKHPKEYLLALEATFSNLNNIGNPKILYTSRELPVFYHFMHPVLTSFKLYVFSKFVWEIPKYKESSYDHEILDKDSLNIASNIWANYSNYHSEEYWTIHVLDMTIQQIQYLKNCGYITDEYIALLKTSIIEVLDKCSKMAERNTKNLSKRTDNFLLFENKILHTSNHIMVNSDKLDFMYITFDNPNFIYTEDKSFLEYSKLWYEKIKRNSYFLGEGTGHLRFQYFEALKQKLNII